MARTVCNKCKAAGRMKLKISCSILCGNSRMHWHTNTHTQRRECVCVCGWVFVCVQRGFRLVWPCELFTCTHARKQSTFKGFQARLKFSHTRPHTHTQSCPNKYNQLIQIETVRIVIKLTFQLASCLQPKFKNYATLSLLPNGAGGHFYGQQQPADIA